jgi:hypothetical protein
MKDEKDLFSLFFILHPSSFILHLSSFILEAELRSPQQGRFTLTGPSFNVIWCAAGINGTLSR